MKPHQIQHFLNQLNNFKRLREEWKQIPLSKGWRIRPDEEVKKAQVKGYKYLIP